MPTSLRSTTDVAVHSIHLMSHGSRSDFADVIAAHAVNHEADIEPPVCRVGGPEGFHATALWLRGAFDGLAHHVEHVAAQDDLVAVDTTMSGRHTGPFVLHDPAGRVQTVWSPTNRPFAVRQTHWLRVTGGLVTEHWAVRDDLGQGFQLGWIPPTPRYLLRCALAKRRAVRAAEALEPRAGTPGPR